MGIYESLGLRRIINAQGRYTVLGGSLLSEGVTRAMTEASRSYVDIFELQRRVGKQLAALTKNEAAYVCNGATAGLFVTTLACMTGTDARAIERLPSLDGLKNEVIIHRMHRIPLDPAITLTGAKLIEIGNVIRTAPGELEAAINERTAAVMYMPGEFFSINVLTLADTIRIAHAHGVPVIVDAAGELPPVENLWRFTRDMGADLAIFCGGKDLSGPQSSGLIVGRSDLVEACFLNGSPQTRLARPMKVGKEEMIGLLTAVEEYLQTDHQARRKRFEEIVQYWRDALGELRGVCFKPASFNGMEERVPRLRMEIDADLTGFTAAELRQRLMAGNPPVAVEQPLNTSSIFLSPETLGDAEAQILVERLREVFAQTRPA